MGQTINVSDIRPIREMRGYEAANRADIRFMQHHKKAFVRVACPSCGSKDATPKYRKDSFVYVQCRQCLTVYMNPRPKEQFLAAFYKQSKRYQYWNDVIFPQSETMRREKIFVPRVHQVLSLCKGYHVSQRTLLEVGSGFGTFLSEMTKKHAFTSVIGVEPTRHLAQTIRDKGLLVLEKTIEEIPPRTITADVVVNFEVIEHLFSPKKFLRSIYRILNTGGIVITTCPNVLGFDIKTLGALSDTVDVEHLNLFTPRSLSMLANNCGFTVLEVQTPGMLDADLVRKKVLSEEYTLKNPFLQSVLIDQWDRLGRSFQQFLQDNLLSSNMLLVARK